ncbi:MAG: RsmE family RNA methyltransferase [Ilumatobacteraceae bacterium]
MHEALRRSSAHVRVGDVAAPAPDDPTDHHLRRVLRLRDGAAVSATDGAGRWRACRLVGGELEPVGPVVSDPAPRWPVTILAAAPKGERVEWLVQKCTEVGVDRIVLLTADRSVVRWDGERAATHLARLRRIATEAAMQSRRVWLPEICGPVPTVDVLRGATVAEPGGRRLRDSDRFVAIGPEGGWSPDELALAGDLVDLGPHVLRVETAAMVAASQLVSLR